MKIGRMSFAIELDGKIKIVALPQSQERKELLLAVMQSAMDGKIVVSDAPDDFKFVEVDTI
jgi:hypothetical protein